LARRVHEAAQQLELHCRIEKVEDLSRIIEVGVPVPALVVDGKVMVSGNVPDTEQIARLLSGEETT